MIEYCFGQIAVRDMGESNRNWELAGWAAQTLSIWMVRRESQRFDLMGRERSRAGRDDIRSTNQTVQLMKSGGSESRTPNIHRILKTVTLVFRDEKGACSHCDATRLLV